MKISEAHETNITMPPTIQRGSIITIQSCFYKKKHYRWRNLNYSETIPAHPPFSSIKYFFNCDLP